MVDEPCREPMFSKVRLVCGVTLFLSLFSGCVGDPELHVDDELVILPGAVNVRSERGFGGRGVEYEVQADYPAAALIRELSSQLDARGWAPLRYEWGNSDQEGSYSRGWVAFDEDGQTTTLWAADWLRKDGAVSTYIFRYRGSNEKVTVLGHVLAPSEAAEAAHASATAEIAVGPPNVSQLASVP